MRNTPNLKAEKFRRLRGRYYGTGPEDGNNGVFDVAVGSVTLKVIVSDGGSWDHVSVSLPNRTPSWEEMDAVKRLFFRDDETAVQFHVPVADHISCHDYCLHLWRPQDIELPRPPNWMVGTRNQEELEQAVSAVAELEGGTPCQPARSTAPSTPTTPSPSS